MTVAPKIPALFIDMIGLKKLARKAADVVLEVNNIALEDLLNA